MATTLVDIRLLRCMFISNLLVSVYTYVSEFCACEGLENYLKDRMKKNSQEMSTLSSVIATNKFGKKMIGKAAKSKKSLEDIRAQGKKVGTEGIFYFLNDKKDKVDLPSRFYLSIKYKAM